MIAGWDARLSRTSAAAALYEIWLPRLLRAMAAATRSAADRAAAGEQLSLDELLDLFESGDTAHAFVLTGPALDEAVAEAERRMGPDRLAWSWGRIHGLALEHPLATTPARAAALNLPRVPRGGDGTTVNATGSGARQTAGASYREVIDLSDWDRSTTINVPGESGQPGSPYYDNLLNLWAEGRYHPLVFSREEVERHAASRLKLVPKAAGKAIQN
jgi:penicillin amidase